jgi:hypothetical protein
MTRIAALAVKQAGGQPLTDAERQELLQLTGAAQVPTATMKTTLKTMKLSEANVMINKVVQNGMATQEQLVLAQKNLEAIQGQRVTDPEGTVAVEVEAPMGPNDLAQAVFARLDAIEKRLQAPAPATQPTTQGNAGDTGNSGNAGNTGDSTDIGSQNNTARIAALAVKQAGGHALTDAEEAMDTILDRFTQLQKKIQADAVTKEDLEKLWPDWDLRNIIDSAVSIMAKMEALSLVIDEVLPSLERVSKGETIGKGTSGGADDDDDDEDDEDADVIKGDLPMGANVNLSRIVRTKSGDGDGSNTYKDRLEARRAQRNS